MIEIWSIVQRVVTAEPYVGLFAALLVSISIITGRILSDLLKSSNGRAEVWYILSDNIVEDKFKRIGVRVIDSVASNTITLNRLRIRSPSFALVDRILGATIVLICLAPWISAWLGQTAAWGAGTFAYARPSDYAAQNQLLLLLLIAGSLGLVSSFAVGRLQSIASSFAVLLLVFFIILYRAPYFGDRWTVFSMSIFAISIVSITRSGFASVLAIVMFSTLTFVLSDEAHGIHADRTFGSASGAGLLSMVGISAVAFYFLVRHNKLPAHGIPMIAAAALAFGGVGHPRFMATDFHLESALFFSVIALFSLTISMAVRSLVSFGGLIAPSLSLLLFSAIGYYFLYQYGSITLWGDVLKVVQFHLFVPLISIVMIISINITVNLAERGFRCAAPFRFACFDVLLSLAVFAVLFWLFIWVSTSPVRVAGPSFLSVDSILAGIGGDEPTMRWVVYLCLLVVVPSSLHISVSVFSYGAFLPARIRQSMVKWLEREPGAQFGFESLAVATVLSTWTSFFVVAGLFVPILAINAALIHVDILVDFISWPLSGF